MAAEDDDVQEVQPVRRLTPAFVGTAALTVLSAASVAAVVLAAVPAPLAAPAPALAALRVVATDEAAPSPVSLSFPAPGVPAAPSAADAPAGPGAPRARPVDPICEGDGWQQRRGKAALARLRRPADARQMPVAFRPARPHVLGLADLDSARVDVFVRSCARESDALLLHVLAHEVGHVLDATRMTDDLRAAWRDARGIPHGTPWYGCDACTDFATPAGDFAETYAQWQRRTISSRSQLTPAASPAELEDLAARFF